MSNVDLLNCVVREIPLTQGQTAIIDEVDYRRVSTLKWHARRDSHVNDLWYAMRKDGAYDPTILMHRFVIGARKGDKVDHVNGNGLDNRRFNLRLASHANNLANMAIRPRGSSKYKGVYFDTASKKWAAQINQTRIGRYTNEIDAAKAYNAVATLLFGEFARLNEIIE